MPSDNKKIEELARDFLKQWRSGKIPHMGAIDFLDLMDYFSRSGMDFEAELCRYFAEKREPENPEVILTKAHFSADDGDWESACQLVSLGNFTGYDFQLFTVENLVRSAQIGEALPYVLSSTPRHLELPDFDFLYDCATLFRDFGYAEEAVKLLEMITPDYADYYQAQEMRASCYALMGEYEKAKHILNILIDRDSFNPVHWSRLAICCYRNKDYEEAREACENSLAITPTPDTIHLHNLLNFQGSSDKDCMKQLEEALSSQDYLLFLEFADILFARGLYNEASMAYREASVFCPRSSSERRYIIAKLIQSLIHENRMLEVMENLKSIAAYCGDAWEAGFDAAQIAFERGNRNEAIEVLNYTVKRSPLTSSRCGHIVALLAHYQCGEEAASVWEVLKENIKLIPPSYLSYLPE